MNNPVLIDLFVEDRAHEEFLVAVTHRLAHEENKEARPGGHP